MARVVIRRYLDFVGAQLDRTRLEGAGIRAEAIDRAAFLPLTGIGGGVVLEVDEADVSAAEELLADKGLAEEELKEDPSDVRCPRCELEYTQFRRPPLPYGVFFLTLFGLFAAFFWSVSKKRWYCMKCEHVWDDPNIGPKHKTPLPAGIPLPVFRLRRGNQGTGLFLGFLVGIGAAFAATQLREPFRTLGIVTLLLFPLIGWAVGKAITADACSEPTCRAPLPPGSQTCPACKGAIVGIVRRASEHYAETANFRREMVETLADEKQELRIVPVEKAGKARLRKKGKVAPPPPKVWDPPKNS